MKKIISSFMVVMLLVLNLVGLVGCSPTDDQEQESDNNQSVQEENNSSTEDGQTNDQKEQDSTLDDNNSDSDTDSTKPKEADSSDSKEDADSNSDQKLQTQQRMSRLYYYDVEQEQVFYIDEKVDVVDGAYINALTKALKNNQDNEDFVTINEDTFVTSAELDEEHGILNIYFNESFHLSTDLDENIEAGFIEALVNTYGYNYNVDKVAIYVENKIYKDQRGSVSTDYFSVNADAATEYE